MKRMVYTLYMKRTYNNLLSEQFHIRDKDNFSPYIIRIKKALGRG